MKKFLFIIAAGATVLFAGCSRETDNSLEEKQGKTYTITATVESPVTRSVASLNETTDKYDFSWESGESIAVLPDGDPIILDFQLVDGSEDRFTYEAGPDEDYTGFGLAVSPYDALQAEAGDDFSYVDGQDVNFFVSLEGSYVQGKSNAVLVAGAPVPQADGSQKFTFKHLAALVRVTYENIPTGVAFMEFTTPDHPITGLFTFSSVDGAQIVAGNFPVGETMGEAWVILPEYTEQIASADFYLPIPTGSYSTFNVRLVYEDMETVPGSERTFSTAAPFTVARADVVECPVITLEDPAGDKYVKVESSLNDYTGDYLIVYEEGSLAFNGGLPALDVAGNVAGVVIDNGEIAFGETTYGYQFHIAKIGDTGNYSIQSVSGKYIGVSSNSNGLKTSENASDYPHTISIGSDKNAVISAVFKDSEMKIRYNKASDQNRFRYYKSGQQPVALYKLNGRLDLSFPTLIAEDVEIIANQTEAMVNFSTNQNWTVTATSDLLVSNVNASGTKDDPQSVALSFKTVNTTFEDKIVTVHIAAGALAKEITVTQKGVVPAISVSPTSASVAADATSSWFTVTSNFNWNILSVTVDGQTASSGFSASVDADDAAKVNVVFPSNIAATTTNARSIVVTVGDENYKTAKFTVTQVGNVVQGGENEVTDVLTRATTGVTDTNYSNWSDKTCNSDAVYAGNSAGDNESIQLRTNNSNSGIISTTSGGKVKSVSVVWNSNTSSGRTIDIYGSNTAYTSASDLYDSSKRGTKLGSITYNSQGPVTVSGDYKYIGIRSNSGALYLTEISIVWDTAAGSGDSGDDQTVHAATLSLGPVANNKIDDVSKTFTDDENNTWTVTTEGTTSFTNNNGWTYSQVGSSSKPATSITFTTTLANNATDISLEAKFGGFSGTVGTISLKVGGDVIGTGSLRATNDVTVSSAETGSGKVLTVTVTNISKGVKCYYIKATYTI